MDRRTGTIAVAFALLAVLVAVYLSAGSRAGADLGAEAAPPTSAPTSREPASRAADVRPPEAAATGNGVAAPGVVGPRMHVLVVDSRRRPLAAARVEARAGAATAVLRTADDGTCWLPIAPSDQTVQLAVEAEGCFHVRAHFECRAELKVTLPRARALAGTVRDQATQQPVAGALVSLPHGSCRGCAADRVQAGSDGGFTLAALPTGRSTVLVVSAEGYPTQVTRLQVQDEPGPVRRDLLLRRGVTVRATVVDFDSSAPVAGVAVRDFVHTGEVWARTDAAGRFEALLLPDEQGRLVVELTARGYCRVTCRLAAEPAATGELRIPYPRSAPITGTVRDPQGNPVPGAQISVAPDLRGRAARSTEPSRTALDTLPSGWSVDAEDYHPTAQAGADGHFTTTGLVPWSEDWQVTVRHPRYLDGRAKVARAGAPGEAVAVAVTLSPLGATGTVAGHVSLNGQPTAARLQWRGPTRNGSVQAGRTGDFRLEQVEAGTVEVQVWPEAVGWPRPQTLLPEAARPVAVAADTEARCDFALTLAQARITGHVRRPDGSPLAGVLVLARCDTVDCSERSKDDGTFAIAVPAALGPWQVLATADDQTAVCRGVAAGSADVDLVLPYTGRLRWRAVDAGTGVALRADLHWRQTSDANWTGSRPMNLASDGDEQGFAILSLAVGRYVLVARAQSQGYQPETSPELQVAAGTTAEVTLRLRRGARVQLRLQGEPLPAEATVLLLDAATADQVRYTRATRSWDAGLGYPDLFERVVRFDRDGIAQVLGLRAGRLRLRVFDADLELEPAELVVGEGEDCSLTVRPQPTRR